MRKLNPEREARRRARQFDDTGEPDSYYAHISAMTCIVTGWYPVDAAHVLGTRGAGHGPEGMAPLHRKVHRWYDDAMVSDEAFFNEWGVSRQDIRSWAIQEQQRWESER